MEGFDETGTADRLVDDTESQSRMFIKIVSHHHSQLTEPTIIPLDISSQMDTSSTSGSAKPPDDNREDRPWAPFRTLADFEYAESVITGGMSKETINLQLHGLRNGWATGSNITFRNYDDMEKSMEAAREYGTRVSHFSEALIANSWGDIKFQPGKVSAEYNGKTFEFEFQYRNPWEWICSLVTDSSLCDRIAWYPVRKYLHENGRVTRLIDEPYTANKWWEVQVPGIISFLFIILTEHD
jgi:hypothetical protein